MAVTVGDASPAYRHTRCCVAAHESWYELNSPRRNATAKNAIVCWGKEMGTEGGLVHLMSLCPGYYINCTPFAIFSDLFPHILSKFDLTAEREWIRHSVTRRPEDTCVSSGIFESTALLRTMSTRPCHPQVGVAFLLPIWIQTFTCTYGQMRRLLVHSKRQSTSPKNSAPVVRGEIRQLSGPRRRKAYTQPERKPRGCTWIRIDFSYI